MATQLRQTLLIIVAGIVALTVLIGLILPLAVGMRPNPGSDAKDSTSRSVVTGVASQALSQTATRVLLPSAAEATVMLAVAPGAPTKMPPSLPVNADRQPATPASQAATREPLPSPPATRVPETPPAAVTKAQPPPAGPVVRIDQGPLNLRTGPGTSFVIMAVASEGATFPILAHSADGAWW